MSYLGLAIDISLELDPTYNLIAHCRALCKAGISVYVAVSKIQLLSRRSRY